MYSYAAELADQVLRAVAATRPMPASGIGGRQCEDNPGQVDRDDGRGGCFGRSMQSGFLS